ncbi:MAG: hypothetical protein ABIF40_03180 [archaeon]
MESENRNLITFEKILGQYSIAGALCSNADVVDFVDDTKQGILVVDTCGHNIEDGNEMRNFVRRTIEGGWGIEGNAEQELKKLGQMFNSLRKPGESQFVDKWYTCVSASYTQFDNDLITIAMGGALGKTYILRLDETLIINHMDRVIDYDYQKKHKPAYETRLENDDILFLQTDGFLDNIIKKSLKKGIEWEVADETANKLLDDLLREFQKEPVNVIRNALVNSLKQYFLPLSNRDDDTTFVIVKYI